MKFRISSFSFWKSEKVYFFGGNCYNGSGGIMKVSKTNALRILDQRKIKYEVHEYEFDEKSLEGHHGVKEENEENNRIYKTLVLKGQNEYIVFCLPITKEIDLKLLAKASGNKSVEMLPQKIC